MGWGKSLKNHSDTFNQQFPREWATANLPFYVKLINLICMLNMMIQIPLDIMWFGTELSQKYLLIRLLVISVCATCLFLNRYIRSFELGLTLLIAPAIAANAAFIFFILTTDDQNLQAVGNGSLIIAFFSAFLVHRFSWVSHLLMVLGVAISIIFWVSTEDEYFSYFNHLTLTHFFSWLIMVYFRSDFILCGRCRDRE